MRWLVPLLNGQTNQVVLVAIQLAPPDCCTRHLMKLLITVLTCASMTKGLSAQTEQAPLTSPHAITMRIKADDSVGSKLALRKNFEDKTGMRFGRWTVLGFSHKIGKKLKWDCLCDCGTKRAVYTFALKTSGSCGCLQKEITSERCIRHGLHGTPEYYVWAQIKQRTGNPSCRSFKNYGGRGISMCKEWESFEQFIADMGLRPSSKHSIERIDNDGDYCPENCKWATWLKQGNNRRTNRIVTIDGKSMTVAELERLSGIPRSRLYYRLSHGWPADRVLS